MLYGLNAMKVHFIIIVKVLFWVLYMNDTVATAQKRQINVAQTHIYIICQVMLVSQAGSRLVIQLNYRRVTYFQGYKISWILKIFL